MNAEQLAAFAARTNNEIYDAEYKGGTWMCSHVETAETLEHWIESSTRWNERSSLHKGEIAGLPYICWSKIQMNKGDRRQPLTVVDFGDERSVIEVDMTDFDYM